MYRLNLIGFGVVGQGLAEILEQKREILKAKYGFEFVITAVSDKIKGSAYKPEGLEIRKLLTLATTNHLDAYPQAITGWDAIKTIKEAEGDVVVEATYTDIKTGGEALGHIRTAFQVGKSVVTSNKGPIALAYKELSTMAKEKGLFLGFEGTVMSGTPVISLATKNLAGAKITGFEGIVNGTTNFILTRMEMGFEYAEALREAQRLGYAEAVPDADVEGWDAVAKVTILANLLLDADIKPSEVDRTGITCISLDHIKDAKSEGKRYKLMAQAFVEEGKVCASVMPRRIPLTDPLAAVMGATNAITFYTDLLEKVMIIGPGAGKKETGFAILSDLLAMHRMKK